jgi:DHA2 family multidrug resistance protein
VDNVSLSNPITLDRIDQLTQFFTDRGADPVTAHNQAITQIANIVRREANVLSFNDCFLFMGFTLFAGALLVLLLKKVKPTKGAAGH